MKDSFCSVVLSFLMQSEWRVVRDRIDQECENLARYQELGPPLVAQCLLISGEDHRHRWHPGFDAIAICRALWRRIAYGLREGASTIEQQIVRTITGRYERTLQRKLLEILLAILVSRFYAKSQLPAIYLAIAYYGWRMNGYRQACERLKLHPSSLSLEDAAGLVARLKYPEPRVAPITRVLQIRRRSQHLLRLFHRHLADGTYGHLNGTPIRSRSAAFGLAEPVS